MIRCQIDLTIGVFVQNLEMLCNEMGVGKFFFALGYFDNWSMENVDKCHKMGVLAFSSLLIQRIALLHPKIKLELKAKEIMNQMKKIGVDGIIIDSIFHNYLFNCTI